MPTTDAADEAPETAPRVRLLPDDLVDQISAGEVVERPASVVKELVENALDAGATRVRVEVRDGGSAWIAVTDDGHGMTPEDARLALQRHATSKLRSAEDLQRIRSFGFRGEALPAIASVSQLRLRTRARGSDEAFELRVAGGELLEARAAAGAPGTRVEIAELFAQVPARRKFLKSPQTEWSHVADWLTRAALVRPALHLDVRRDDRAPLVWPATDDPLDRVAAVLGEEEAAALVPGACSEGRLELRLFASRPDRHRATSDGLHLYVNGRPVRDRLLRHAVLEVYRDLLPRGRFPSALLFLQLPPSAVDVNVHPAKWEVRFVEPRAVHSLVTRGLRETIGARRWLAAGARAPLAPSDSSAGPTALNSVRGLDWMLAASAPDVLAVAESPAASSPAMTPHPPALAEAPFRFAELRLVGQVLATYLVAEGRDAVLWIDQHAAHERVLYERLRAAWRGEGVPRQLLLVPAVLELDAAAREALLAAPQALAELGFEVEPFGAEAVALRALPALLAGADPLALLRGLADELHRVSTLGVAPRADSRLVAALDRALATLACHAARRQGDLLERPEQEALLAALDTIPWAPTCPHGRPVAVPFARSEIERRFLRR